MSIPTMKVCDQPNRTVTIAYLEGRTGFYSIRGVDMDIARLLFDLLSGGKIEVGTMQKLMRALDVDRDYD